VKKSKRRQGAMTGMPLEETGVGGGSLALVRLVPAACD
jgi:hypothetical protein